MLTDLLDWAFTVLIAIAASHAGNHFTGFIINKWSKPKFNSKGLR